MRRTSIGSWAYNVGTYGENPIPFDTVLEKLAELVFDGIELGIRVDAWQATAKCKTALDALNRKYG